MNAGAHHRAVSITPRMSNTASGFSTGGVDQPPPWTHELGPVVAPAIAFYIEALVSNTARELGRAR